MANTRDRRDAGHGRGDLTEEVQDIIGALHEVQAFAEAVPRGAEIRAPQPT